MIDVRLGQFRLDQHDLVFGPDLSLPAFEAGGVATFARTDSKGYATYSFEASIGDMPAEFVVSFRFGKLHLIGWYPKKGSNRRLVGWFSLSNDI